MKLEGLKVMVSESTVNYSFVISTCLSSGFSTVTNFVIISLTTEVNSIGFKASGGETLKLILY